MRKINADKVLFIKLGQGGKYETNCIEKDNTLRLGYSEVDHQLCINGHWDKVHNYFTTEENSKTFVATSHTNQIKQFYKQDEKDFETLIDLIFRQAGWQRVGQTGKTQKTLDLELLAPVTGETAVVQIKAQSDLNQFLTYQDEFAKMTDYDKFFYVVHTAKSNLDNYENETDTNLYLVDKVAELTISSGLVEWVIKKTS